MGRGSDQYSLNKQRQVLAVREQALKALGDKPHPPLDQDTLVQLQRLSPSKLAPCLFKRKRGEGLVAAYLIQEIGTKSYRFLVRFDTWCIQRAPRNVQLLRIRPEHVALFEEIASMQELAALGIAKLAAMARKTNRRSA